MEMSVVSIFTQELLKQLLPWLVSLIVAALIKFATDTWLKFKAARPDKAATLERVAVMAVYAAEQAKINKLTEDKLTWAMEWAESFLKREYNLTLDLKDIMAAIEAEVGKRNVIVKPQSVE